MGWPGLRSTGRHRGRCGDVLVHVRDVHVIDADMIDVIHAVGFQERRRAVCEDGSGCSSSPANFSQLDNYVTNTIDKYHEISQKYVRAVKRQKPESKALRTSKTVDWKLFGFSSIESAVLFFF